MSIEHLEFEFKNGVNAVVGENGAGKTQTLIALLQAFYNKNPKSDTDVLNETYNKITQQPYKIKVYFVKNDDKYIVINDRQSNKIVIFENDIDISPKGIKNQLNKIEEILGMNYNTFSAFYYLSTVSIKNIFNVSNSENLVYKFFDIETVEALNKFLKDKNKEFKKEYQLLMTTIKSTERQLNMLNDFEMVDKEKLINRKLILQESLLNLQESKEKKKIVLLQNKLKSIDEKIQLLKQDFYSYDNTRKYIKKQLEQLKGGICPVCGSKVESNVKSLQKEYDEIFNKQKEISEKKNKLLQERQQVNEILENLQNEYEIKEEKVKRELSSIEDKLLMYEKDFEKYQRLQKNIEILQSEKKQVLERLKEIKQYLAYTSVGLSVIKSNAITKEYLKSFVILLNNKINEITKLVNFNLQIIVLEHKGKITFTFIHNGIEKTLNSLSSGEKTRVALIVLFAVLDTLQLLSQNKLNLLVLDELLGVLDEKGIKVLKTLLNVYRKQIAIYVVLHHNEIAESYFDNVYYVYKENNLTNIKEKEK